MAQYRQRCPGCVGGQAVAAVDAERFTRKAERHRRSAAEATYRANRASQNGGNQEAILEHQGDAALHTALADRSEQRAKRAIARLIAASPVRCFVCGDTGEITGNSCVGMVSA